MSKTPFHPPNWDTSSLGRPTDVYALQCSALREHLRHCGSQRGPLHALRTGADELQRLLAGHVVTSVLLLVALLVGALWLAS